MCWALAFASVVLLTCAQSDLFRDDLRNQAGQEEWIKLQQQVQQERQAANPQVAYKIDAAELQPAAAPTQQLPVNLAISDDIAEHVLSFAQSLTKQLNQEYAKTTIFSPLSIANAMALLQLGAKGRSYAELSQVFGQADNVQFHEQFALMQHDVQQRFNDTTSPQRQLDQWHWQSLRKALRAYPRNLHAPVNIDVANGMFVQQGFYLNDDYVRAAQQLYKAKLELLDFNRQPAVAKRTINAWVSEHTKGKIREIISDVPEDTRVILANALYFKAVWEIDFIKGATKPEMFYPNGLDTQPEVPVDMMVGVGVFPYYEDEQLNCRILGLPYHGHLATMYVIQPLLESSIERLANLQQTLSAADIQQMISKMTRRSIIVAFPKLDLTESFSLRNHLTEMGIGGMFTPIQSDLSLIGGRHAPNASTGGNSLFNLEQQRQAAKASQAPTPPSDLIVSDILHKVNFVVNEQGTEAAAATAAVLKKSGPELTFRAETPFMLLVRHDVTKLPLFYGIINEPPRSRQQH